MRNIEVTPPDDRGISWVIDTDTGQRLGGFAPTRAAEVNTLSIIGIPTVPLGLPGAVSTPAEAVELIVKHADDFPDHHVG